MEKELRILMVEDVPTDAELEIRELKRAGLRVTHRRVDTEAAFRDALREYQPELIIADFSMPHFDGMAALALAREIVPDVPFIFVSGTIGEEYAIRALKNGATDYVLKNNLVRLPSAVERALQDREVRAARRQAEDALKLFRQLIDQSNDAVEIVEPETLRFLDVNEKACQDLGYSREELLGMSVHDIDPDLDASSDARIGEALRSKGFAVVERVCRRKDGSTFPVEINIKLVQLHRDYVVAVVRDITERKSQERKIGRLNRILEMLSGINTTIVRVRDRQKLFEEACRIAVEHGNFGIAWIGALDAQKFEIVPVASAGLAADDPLRTTVSRGTGIVGRAMRERRPVYDNDVAANPAGGGERRREAVRRGYRSVIALPLIVGGAVVGNFSLFAKEPNFFDEEEVKLLTELANDISFALDYIGKEERLNYLAYFDPLTGLANRALFHDRVNQALQSPDASGSKAALLVIDLKRFGSVNETYGRQTGDALLQHVAERLGNVVKNRDLLARIGADTFAAALPDVRHEADVAHVLEQGILGSLKQPFPVGGGELRLSAQAGIALFPTDGNDAESLFRNADAALRKAKNSGDEYLFYAPRMNARVAEQLKLENDLRNALLQEQYVLHYQPRFELAGGRLVGLEALIRWKHPERGIVSPAEFVPILEETGMIIEVGRWALQRAARDHAAWRAAGLQAPRIAVNVSPAQLRRSDFVDYLRDALSGIEDAAARIDVEITESMLMEDIEGSIAKLKAVQAMGLQVALDDFGTGYSSLSYLARLPINSLKIDRSFVTRMNEGPEQMAIVTTVISLARALNLKVCAEGLETEEQANLLRLLRCDEAQGYLFGKPMPPDQIETLLAKR